MEKLIKNINIPDLKERLAISQREFFLEKLGRELKNIDLKKLRSFLNGSNRPVVFVHTDTNLSAVSEKTNLILSPAYYWCKKEDLEISSLRKAKKLAHSIFFGQLPEGDFAYKATKIEGEFFFFAYDKDKILNDLLSQGIKKELIGNIYFAQNECTSDKVCKISDRFALIHQDTMVSVMPLQYASDPQEFSSLDIELSNTYFKYRSVGSGQSDKPLLAASLFISLWIIMEFAQEYRLSGEAQRLAELKSGLYKEFGLPATSFQRKSLKTKYETIETRQNRIREVLSKITSFKTTKSRYFEEIALEKESITAVFISDNPEESAADLQRALKRSETAVLKDRVTVSYKL